MADEIEATLAAGESPFSRGSEGDVWPEAARLLAGDRSREFVAAIDLAFEHVADRASAIATLFAGMASDDALTATAAAAALIHHQVSLSSEERDALSDALSKGARDTGDAYRASQLFALLVRLARIEDRYQHAAADTALRIPPTLTPNAVAEHVVASIGLLEAAKTDPMLMEQLSRWGKHADALVQAEAEFQLGRAHVRVACRDAGTREAEMDAARESFRRASTVDDRTDATLWLGVVEFLASFRGGVPPIHQVEPAAARLRGLAHDRIRYHAAPSWALQEDRLLLRATEQMRHTALRLATVAEEPNLGEPLSALARAAAEATTAAAAGPDTALLERGFQESMTRGVALSLDIEVGQALAKVRRLEEFGSPTPEERAYLEGLRDELEELDKRPKADGAAVTAAAPAPTTTTAALLSAVGTGVSTRTGYPLGDRLFDSLWKQLLEIVPSDAPGRTVELVMCGLELLVGFIVRRTIDEKQLGTTMPKYLHATSRGGKGQTALEEDVRSDLLNYVLASEYAYLLDKEATQMGGRADLRLVLPPAPPVTIEAKRELKDASRISIRAAHAAQAQTYVAFGPRVGFLLVLDLTPTELTAEPDVEDRFWLEHIDPVVGSGQHVDYVLVALLSGNRARPSDRQIS